MKRETVLRMLKKRLHESQRVLRERTEQLDLMNVLGGIYDEEREKQIKVNLKTDITELSFLIKALDSRKRIANKENKASKRMNEFLDKVDSLCYEYGYEFYPTINGWTGKTDKNGKYETFACIGDNEAIELIYLDGDGRGK